MLEKMLEDIEQVLSQILNEFVANAPTSFVEADFEVQYLKIQIAHKNKQLDSGEVLALTIALAECSKIWRKLNDK